MVEVIVNLVTPNIFLRDYSYIEYNFDYDFEIVYKVNEILLALSFCRLYLLVEFIIELTKYSSQRAHRACHMKGIDISFGFAVKCLNQEYPATMLFSSLFLMVLVTGYQLHVLESPMNDISGQNYRSLANCFCNFVITTCTVGYGELYPKTWLGRAVGIVISFYGVVFVSVLVTVAT